MEFIQECHSGGKSRFYIGTITHFMTCTMFTIEILIEFYVLAADRGFMLPRTRPELLNGKKSIEYESFLDCFSIILPDRSNMICCPRKSTELLCEIQKTPLDKEISKDKENSQRVRGLQGQIDR
uniref:Uncharacterized protein n=1 Tax=Glossina brevipalpis TaxID=37001 RepID=A0A1A9WCX3_9MUSC